MTYGEATKIAQKIKQQNPHFGAKEILEHQEMPNAYNPKDLLEMAEYAVAMYGIPTPYGAEPEPGRPVTTEKPADYDLFEDAR